MRPGRRHVARADGAPPSSGDIGPGCCTSADLVLEHRSVGRLWRRPVTVTGPRRGGRGQGDAIAVADGAFDVVLVRTDPPVDAGYLAMTLLLELARGDTLVVNDPRGLREANEKLYACRFPELMPPTLVTADTDRSCRSPRSTDGAVLKPLDGHGGDGGRPDRR